MTTPESRWSARRAQILLDDQILRDKFLVQNKIWMKARMAADFAVRKDALEAAHRLNDARKRHVRCKKHARLMQKKNEFHDQQLANALKDVANAVNIAKANAPSVSVPVAFVPVDDTTKATGEIENDSPSLLVLEKDADKGKTNAQLGALKPTPLSSGGAALQADSPSSAPSAPVGTFKCPSNTDENIKPISRKIEDNAQLDAQTSARLSSGGCCHLSQGHSSSSTTAPSEHVDSVKTCLSNGKPSYVPPNAQLDQTLINVPVGEPPPPRGGLSEHSRPRTRAYLRAQLPRGL
jgi:hypothetical protein